MKDEGIMPDNAIGAGEYIEELEGELQLNDLVIPMLQERLEDADESPCICFECIAEYRRSLGQKIH